MPNAKQPWESLVDQIENLQPMILDLSPNRVGAINAILAHQELPIHFQESANGPKYGLDAFRVENLWEVEEAKSYRDDFHGTSWRVLLDVWGQNKLLWIVGTSDFGRTFIVTPQVALKGGHSKEIVWFENYQAFLAKYQLRSKLLEMLRALATHPQINVAGWENYLTSPARVKRLFYEVRNGISAMACRLNEQGFAERWFSGKIAEMGEWVAETSFTLEHLEFPGRGNPCVNCGAYFQFSKNLASGGVECLGCAYEYGTVRKTRVVPLELVRPLTQ